MKRVYLSYDLENDYDLKEKFIQRMDEHEYPFEVFGHSGDIACREEEIHLSLKETDLVFVLCGYKTNTSLNVEKELSCILENKTPFILLNAREDELVTAPANVAKTEPILRWNRNMIHLTHYKMFL